MLHFSKSPAVFGGANVLFSAQSGGVLGDHQFLVGGDDPDLDLGIVGGDEGLLAADLVALRVQLDAEEFQTLADGGAVGGAVLADACGEDEAVQPAEGGGMGVGPFLLYLLFVVLSVLLTVLVEWTVSLLFRLKAARIIIWTNIVSQLIMHFLYLIVTLLTLGFVSSTYLIVVLELLVLVGEWGFYTHKLSGVSRLRVFFYTLTANLLSLFLGGLGTFLLL